MEQRERNVILKGVQTMSSEEECARGMGQRESVNHAAVKDVQIKSSTEECALDMVQRCVQRRDYAAVKDVQIK